MPFFTVNGIDLFYQDMGQGKPVVFLHGFTGSSLDWTLQLEAIRERYRGIALDFRGHGRSSAPPREEDYSVYLNSEDLLSLLRQLDIDRCVLVGHSMGGFTALQFVLDHPDRVAALVLVDTSSGEWDLVPGYAELRAKLDELAMTQGLLAAFEYDAAHNPLRIERFRKQPEQREIVKRKVLSTSVEGYVYVPRSFAKWRPVTSRLKEIQVPTLIFLGEEDRGFLRASQILNHSIPGSELVIVPGAFHNPHEEAPEFFNAYFLKFLDTVSA